MNKFLATVIGIIAAAVIFGILWFFIPLISSILNLAPLYVSIFICCIIFLASFLGIRLFKDKYLKLVPTISALILGVATVATMHDRYSDESYKEGVLIRNNKVYNKLGVKIIEGNGFAELKTADGGNSVIVFQYSLYDYSTVYSIYSLDGVCIANNISRSELDDFLV